MIKKSTKPKTRRASAPRAPKSVSLESQAGDDGERLADLEHLDELCHMKDRLFGLEAGILGACDGGMQFDHGLTHLAADISAATEACVEAFEAERQRRLTPEQREWHRMVEERLAQRKTT